MAAAFNAAELGAEGFEGRQRQNATSAHSREAAALAPLLPVLNDLATVESIVVAGMRTAKSATHTESHSKTCTVRVHHLLPLPRFRPALMSLHWAAHRRVAVAEAAGPARPCRPSSGSGTGKVPCAAAAAAAAATAPSPGHADAAAFGAHVRGRCSGTASISTAAAACCHLCGRCRGQAAASSLCPWLSLGLSTRSWPRVRRRLPADLPGQLAGAAAPDVWSGTPAAAGGRAR